MNTDAVVVSVPDVLSGAPSGSYIMYWQSLLMGNKGVTVFMNKTMAKVIVACSTLA